MSTTSTSMDGSRLLLYDHGDSFVLQFRSHSGRYNQERPGGIEVSDALYVVDSYSKDGTVALSESVVQHPFEHYGAQGNWAIDNLPILVDPEEVIFQAY
jgi:hypothetical protein